MFHIYMIVRHKGFKIKTKIFSEDVPKGYTIKGFKVLILLSICMNITSLYLTYITPLI